MNPQIELRKQKLEHEKELKDFSRFIWKYLGVLVILFALIWWAYL